MGVVIVTSIPLILVAIGIGFGCYFLGRKNGREEVMMNPQVYGIPTIPPSGIAGPPPPPGAASPSPVHMFNVKNQGPVNV
ncbi:hypothetical protein QJS10_CPB11g01533 [Acorus calamus]|uniref:Uncharacterized protein n=1 Tax=Acorus calamus TaxID=4465 RepID=A0AAV9DTX9_ACOCL|nr:hypothetical protein QJS10_CPB11g01533 [Acorus calamus]